MLQKKTIDIELENDEETSWTLSHELETRDVIAALYDSRGQSLSFQVQIIDENTIKIQLDKPIETKRSDTFRLILVA